MPWLSYSNSELKLKPSSIWIQNGNSVDPLVYLKMESAMGVEYIGMIGHYL